MGKKKKFINKKKSQTFQLVSPDSSHPHPHPHPHPHYDEKSSANSPVLVRIDANSRYSTNTFFHANNQVPNSIFSDDYSASPLPDDLRREMLELGFPDDGYNYLVHMREINNTGAASAYYHNSKAKLNQLPRDVKSYDASRVDISEVNITSDEKSIYSVASQTVGVKIQNAVDPEVDALLDDSDLSRVGSDVEDLEEDFVFNANILDDPSFVELEGKLCLVDEYIVNKKESLELSASCLQEKVVGSFGVDEVRNHMHNPGDI